jgi:hypothetical protein
MTRSILATLLAALIGSSAAFAIDRGRISPSLYDTMSKAPGPQKVIVLLWEQEITTPSIGRFDADLTLEAYRAEAERTIEEVLRSVPATVQVSARYQSFSGFAATADWHAIGRLTEHPYVRMIIPDGPVQLHRAEGNPLMGVTTPYNEGKRGSGVTVAVIDDGIDYTHPELGGSGFPNSVVIGGRDFEYNVDDPSPVFDPSAGAFETHGTAVAGIIAGRGDTLTGGRGVAPDAKIVGLRVATIAQVLTALDWVVTRKNTFNPPIQVVNMSLGFDDLGFFTANCDNHQNALPFRQVVDRLETAGVVVVASSGNENWSDRTSLPSCLSRVVSVGAVYDANIGSAAFGGPRPCQDGITAADRVTCYSNSAAFLSVLAPSHNARTPRAGGGYENQFGGTSAASPYAAGVVALMMSAKPGLTPAQYRGFLKSSGNSILDPKSNITSPRINAQAALQALSGGSQPPAGENVIFVPAAARLQGGGGLFFKSDLRIMNRSSATASVTAFILSGIDNTTAPTVQFTIPGGNVAALNDVVQSLFGIPSGGGALLFISSQPLRVTSNLYTTNNLCPEKGGTFGQFIDGSPIGKAGRNQTIYHVIHNADFRSNIGVVSTADAAATVTITLKSGTGATLGVKVLNLGPYGWQQVNRIFDDVGAPASSNAYALVSSTQPVLSYVSVVDNRTGDQYYVAGEN